VVDGRQAGADVEELPDADLAGQVPDRAGEEGPGVPRHVHDLRVDGDELVAGGAVDGVVLLAAQPVVPDARGLGDRAVDLRFGRPAAPCRAVRCRISHGRLLVRAGTFPPQEVTRKSPTCPPGWERKVSGAPGRRAAHRRRFPPDLARYAAEK